MPISLVRKLVNRLPELGEVGTEAAANFSHYLQHAYLGVTLDDAFGVACRPGQSPWWRAEQYAKRNQAISELAATVPGDSIEARAYALFAILSNPPTEHLTGRQRYLRTVILSVDVCRIPGPGRITQLLECVNK